MAVSQGECGGGPRNGRSPSSTVITPENQSGGCHRGALEKSARNASNPKAKSHQAGFGAPEPALANVDLPTDARHSRSWLAGLGHSWGARFVKINIAGPREEKRAGIYALLNSVPGLCLPVGPFIGRQHGP